MVIGFDFDKVFVNYPPFVPYTLIDFLYKGSSFFKKANKSTEMKYRFPGNLEQKVRVITHYPIFRPAISENINALKKIHKKHAIKTYLVSSRYGFLEGKTNEILKKYELSRYFNGVYFNFENEQPHIFKEKTIKKLKIDIYIDDDLQLAIYLSTKMPSLKIFWITNNTKVSLKLPANITPIKNLNKIEKHLKIK